MCSMSFRGRRFGKKIESLEAATTWRHDEPPRTIDHILWTDGKYTEVWTPMYKNGGFAGWGDGDNDAWLPIPPMEVEDD